MENSPSCPFKWPKLRRARLGSLFCLLYAPGKEDKHFMIAPLDPALPDGGSA